MGALPGEEEEDKEGRGEAALHAEMEVQRVGGEAGGAGELQELRFWGTDWQQHQTGTVGGSAGTEDTHQQCQSIARHWGALGGEGRGEERGGLHGRKGGALVRYFNLLNRLEEGSSFPQRGLNAVSLV